MGQTRRQFLKTTAVGAGAAASTISFPMVSRGQTKKLVVWWNRGYYKEEDESMLKIAEEFRKAKNVDLDISFTIQEDLRNKIISALTARQQLEMVVRWGEGASTRDARRRTDEMLSLLGLAMSMYW